MKACLLFVLVLSACSTRPARNDVQEVVETDAPAAEAQVDTIEQDTADAVAVDASMDASMNAGPHRVLFIGNSYTYVNDLPGVFRSIAMASDFPVETVSVVEGGATLYTHYRVNQSALPAIRDGRFNTVVLQGQSVEPVESTEFFLHFASLFGAEVTRAGARSVWFATWARVAGDAFYSSAQSVRNPEEMTRGLEQAYSSAARVSGGDVARVGAAWQRSLQAMPAVALHVGDGSHPTVEGTLLAACVMFQTVAQRAPRLPDPPPLGIAPATARALCGLAASENCTGNTLRCGGTCVDRTRDFAHCGACGTRCTNGNGCTDGRCQCLPASVRYTTLSALRAVDAQCASVTAPCARAAHRWCATQPCATSGFGPIFTADNEVDPICVNADVQRVRYAELQALVPACDGVMEREGLPCRTAAHRYCVARGATGGFGPVDAEGEQATVSCLRTRTTVMTHSFTVLRTVYPQCQNATTLANCSVAVHRVCRRTGHLGGVGPVEIAGDMVTFLCVDE